MSDFAMRTSSLPPPVMQFDTPRGDRSLSLGDARVLGSGISHDGGALEGSVLISVLDRSHSAEAEQSASGERLASGKAGFGSRFLGGLVSALAAVPKLAAALLTTIIAVPLGYLVKGLGSLTGMSEAQQARATLHADFGDTSKSAILNRSIATPAGQQDISALMDSYRLSLGGDKRISAAEMNMYVALGEKIVDAVKAGDGKPPIMVTGPSGDVHALESNLDTTRAISWFLQAKAMSDNASAGRPVTELRSGSMVVADPGNKLHTFLSSADNAYGRCSTHFQERSANVDGGALGGLKAFWNGGWSAGMAYATGGQPLQRGIEDFSSKLPSGGGTLLFDKLSDGKASGAGELFMKWEDVGVPNSFGFSGTHADKADGWGDKILGRGFAFTRGLGHSLHFAANADPGAAYRGEKMAKGEAKNIFNAFVAAVDGAGLPKTEAEALKKDVGKHGAAFMKDKLAELIGDGQLHGRDGALQAVSQRLDAFMTAMGADLGIARKGAEVHVTI
jgi:hypothetical protein